MVTLFATDAESSSGPPYIAKLFERVGNSYTLIVKTGLFHEGVMQTSQLMEMGDMVFVFDNEVATYTRQGRMRSSLTNANGDFTGCSGGVNAKSGLHSVVTTDSTCLPSCRPTAALFRPCNSSKRYIFAV